MGGYERIAEVLGQGSQSVFCSLTMFKLSSGEHAFVVGLSGLEHVVNHSCQFVCGSGDRLGGSESGSDATVEFTQGRLAFLKRLCSHPEGYRNSVLDLSRSGPEHLSATDVVVRA